MTTRVADCGSFVVNSYDRKDHKEQVMTLDGVFALERERYDHFLDLSRDQLAFRDQFGLWHELQLSDTRLGPKPLDVLFALQLSAGHFVECADLVALTGNGYLLVPGNVSRHLVTLRRVHCEDWPAPRFFRTRRSRGLAVMWPADRTWIRIERINPRLDGAATTPERPAA